jgi:hypothetical protein
LEMPSAQAGGISVFIEEALAGPQTKASIDG